MLTYNGVELSLDTPEITAWLESDEARQRGYSLEQTLLDSILPANDSWAWMQRASMPPPRIGSFYWPTGASRWAVGYFLATRDQINAIIDKNNYTSIEPKEFRIGFASDPPLQDESQEPNLIVTDLYLLPPVPLAYTRGGGANLFLLVLVDKRFYWRWKDVDDPGEETFELNSSGGNSPPISWLDYISLSGASLDSGNIVFPSAVDPAYLNVDLYSLAVRSDTNDRLRHANEMFDVAAANIGRCVAVDFDGKVNILAFDESENRQTENENMRHRRMYGEDAAQSFANWAYALLPREVSVTFPRRHATCGYPLNGWYRKSLTLESGIEDRVLNIQSSAWALVTDEELETNNGLVPMNQAKLDQLAERLRNDLTQRFNHLLDITYGSICRLKPNFYADVITFTYRHDACNTRVRSAPWNSHVQMSNHQDPEVPDEMKFPIVATMKENLPPSGSANAEVASGEGASIIIKVVDQLGGVDLGVKVVVSLESSDYPPRLLVHAAGCD